MYLEAIDTVASNVAKEDTVEENTTCHDPTNPVDKFSKTDILEVQLPYERSDSSGSVKNAPRKSEELIISNLCFLRISTGNVDNAEINKDRISKQRKPQYIDDKIKKKKRRKMGW